MGPASYGALDPATRQTGHTVFQATRIGRTFFEDPTPTAAPQTSNRTGWSGNARLSEGPARSRVITWDLNGSSFAARTGLALQRASPPRGADSAAPVALNPVSRAISRIPWPCRCSTRISKAASNSTLQHPIELVDRLSIGDLA